MARAKGKKKQGGRPPGQSNPVQPELKPPGCPMHQATQQVVGQVDPSNTDLDIASPAGDPVDPPLQEPSSSTYRPPLDTRAPPYVARSNQKPSWSLTPSSSSRPHIIEIEMVTSNSVHSGQISLHRIDDDGDGATSRQSYHSVCTE
jgi:hypothetical protein